jgi:transposase
VFLFTHQSLFTSVTKQNNNVLVCILTFICDKNIKTPNISLIKMNGHDLSAQSKTIIYDVYCYLKDLVTNNPNGRVGDIFNQTQKCAAEACKVSLSSVQRICAEAYNADNSLLDGNVVFKDPKRNGTEKSITNVDDFEKDVIRRTVQECYDKGEYPTCGKLKEALKEKIGFKGSESSLRTILKRIGYKYKRCNDGRRFFMERADIVAARVTFLRKMHNERANKLERPIIYLDETWVNQNHCKKYIWQSSDSKGGLKVPVGKGSRLIICHAGSAKHGFLEGAGLIFQSKKARANTDYHQEMNSEVFKEWFIDMLRGLEEGCVIVMDNASYHSTYY